jgi:hypothetical protein
LSLAAALISSSFGALRITEFMAANESGLRDEDGHFSDWIEIHNPDSTPVSLAGYHLTDSSSNPDKWTFPAVTLEPGAYLVVFASGKNRINPAGQLHTDFELSAEGEYLALIAPDGATVISSFGIGYPEQFENVSFGLSGAAAPFVWTFFSGPSPGAANVGGTRAGPIFDTVLKNPLQPVSGPLTVTATIRRANDPVSAVRLYYRKMFAAESSVSMADDGSGRDARAGDGIWTAIIPADAFAPGEMTRWRFVATDTLGTETKEPPYRSTIDSHQYYGTVGQDPDLKSNLPVVHWFTSNANGAGTTSGSRGALYYNGEFYDNVLFNLHGQSTAGFPKKSYNIDFNRTQRFRWSTNAPRVADIDLLTNWADKSKVRHVLGYEVMRESGVAAHFAFTVRVEQNGNFFSTADFVEDADEIYLERAGLNPEGALYKVYSNVLNKDQGDSATVGVEKKTRRFENNSDLQALINGLDLTGTNLTTYLYDNIDIPRCVSMLAANSVIRNIDMHRKNWYIYRDTGRSGEWAILPWDLDLSHGRVWNQQNTYFDNALYTDSFVVSGTSIRLVSHLFANPAIRAMIMRRIRTLSDRFLQPPPPAGTLESELYYERRLNEQSALIDPPNIIPSDAQRDFQKWGSWLQGGATVSYTNTNVAVETMTEAIQRWKTQYLPARRNYIYNTQIVGRGGEIPLPQTSVVSVDYTPLVAAGAAAKALVPASGALSATWIGIPSSEPFNTAGWLSGATGVGYERGTGYESMIGLDVGNQMASNNTVYIRLEFDVANPAIFDRLELRIKYDDGFVAFLNGAVLVSANAPASPQWNSAATGSHEASATVYDIFDVTSRLGNLRSGRNVLAIQGLNDNVTSSDMIIVPELYAGRRGSGIERQPILRFGTIEPNPASGNQDQEFIQLINPNSMAVDISDWRVSGGVEHTFAPGTVLPANGRLYLCPSAAAFRARTVSPKGGEGLFVQGGYQGHLSSFGETLTLLDASGATNNSTSYPGQPSDAQRFLVVSEVMYHPGINDLAEFIEVLNISSNVTLNLTGVRFTQGVEFNFTGSTHTSLPPGARAVVVRDLTTFKSLYGTNLPVAGVFTNTSALSNGSELIKLEDADNGTIKEFTYSDQPPWPTAADGGGHSLVLIAPETNPDPAIASNWRASLRPGGSPGTPDNAGFSGDPAADTNGNGERDLIDYVLGNNLGLPPIFPKTTFQAEPLGGPTTLQLVYPVSQNAQNTIVSAYFSTNLVAWQDASAHLEILSRTPLGDGRELVSFRIKSPLREETRIFLRIGAVAR